MAKINLRNLKLFANTNITDIGMFLIRMVRFISNSIQELVTNNLNINDIDFYIKNKKLILPKLDNSDFKHTSDLNNKLEILDQENNNLKTQLANYKNKISEISVNKDQEIEMLKSQVENKDKQINEFKKLFQAIQQRSNQKNENIKII